MQFQDLREFISYLEKNGQLDKISHEIDTNLEMTQFSDQVLRRHGPALLFENPKNHTIPVLTNLFGTPKRVALAIGETDPSKLREIGELLAFLKEPQPPENLRSIIKQFPIFKKILAMKSKKLSSPPCQEVIIEKDDINLSQLPVQKCWPLDAAPLITWGLTITKGPHKKRQNIGIYRQQVIGKNRIIMRWLAHRGGALDYREFRLEHPNKPFPVAVALGADPATIIAAVTPIPDTLSEYAFAGLLRGKKTYVAHSFVSDEITVPAYSEIILEGYIYPNDMADEGPYGDHTGYYNEIDSFPVMTVERITHRKNPIYHSTYTGRPPDEPAMLGVALNEVFIPIIQKQFPEIIDFYLPPEGCSYRMAVVSIKKQYPGHAKRLMLGVWSYLRQFMYTKFVVIVDEDVNCRNWDDVIWAITTRMDPVRDTVMVDNTPIDYLDFASPISGLGSKMGLDATNKWKGETDREWGIPIEMDQEIKDRVSALLKEYGYEK